MKFWVWGLLDAELFVDYHQHGSSKYEIECYWFGMEVLASWWGSGLIYPVKFIGSFLLGSLFFGMMSILGWFGDACIEIYSLLN